jgi:Holliday junction resolvase
VAEPLSARAELDRHVPEREFQRQITDLADLTGWRWFHAYDSRRSPAGFPDLVLVRRGRLLFFEVKSASGRISRPQAAWLLDLAQVPGVVALAVRPSDWPKVQRLLQGGSPSGQTRP